MSTATEAPHQLHHKQEKQPFAITVRYNEVPKEIKVRHEETVKQVREHAIRAFQPEASHTFALHNRAGEELDERLTVEQAGIWEHDTLLLQTSKKPFDVTVIYNGVPKEIQVRREETVKQVLDRAVAAFQPMPAPHTMSLFNQAGQELNDSLTVDQAGIRPHDKLLLRPSTVKGG